MFLCFRFSYTIITRCPLLLFTLFVPFSFVCAAFFRLLLSFRSPATRTHAHTQQTGHNRHNARFSVVFRTQCSSDTPKHERGTTPLPSAGPGPLHTKGARGLGIDQGPCTPGGALRCFCVAGCCCCCTCLLDARCCCVSLSVVGGVWCSFACGACCVCGVVLLCCVCEVWCVWCVVWCVVCAFRLCCWATGRKCECLAESATSCSGLTLKLEIGKIWWLLHVFVQMIFQCGPSHGKQKMGDEG